MVGWANYLLAWMWLLWTGAWMWLLWTGIGIVGGGIMLAFDQWRLYRQRPRPDEVRAFADQLGARHGRDAFRINGEAMIAARRARQFDRRRFLREVSGEPAARLAARKPEGHGSVNDRYPAEQHPPR